MEIFYAIGRWLEYELGFVIKFSAVMVAIVLILLALNLRSIKKRKK